MLVQCLISLRVKIAVCSFVCFLTKTSYWLSPFEVDKRPIVVYSYQHTYYTGSLTEKLLPYCNDNGVLACSLISTKVLLLRTNYTWPEVRVDQVKANARWEAWAMSLTPFYPVEINGYQCIPKMAGRIEPVPSP